MSTSTAEPRRPARGPWLGVGLTVVALLVATASLGRPATPAVTGAAAWLPPDGLRTRVESDLGVAAVEWSRPTPFALAQSAPAAFWTWAGVSKVEWDTADYLRSSSYLLDDAGGVAGHRQVLRVLGPDGGTVALDVSDGGETLLFEPGLLDLPGDLSVGSTWTSTGEVARQQPGSEWEINPYQATLRGKAPEDPGLAAAGCVTVTTELGFGAESRSRDQTWCPGAGIVAGRDGDTTWAGTDTAPKATQPVVEDFDWTQADTLGFTGRTLNQAGVGVTFVSPVSPPGILPDGRVVFTNMLVPDVLALDPAPDPAPVVWSAKPGLTPTAAASFGGLTVVTTSDRKLIGYGSEGQWLWEAPLSDIARVAPVLVGGRTIVVATLDGVVTGYDPTTGAQAWRAGVAAEVRRPLLATGDRVLVPDQSGALTCFDVAGTQVWAIDTGVVLSLAVSDGAEPVVVVAREGSPVLQGYRRSDGERVWRVRHYDDAREIVSLGDRFLLRDTDRTTAIDATTGAVAWSWAQARTWAALGGGDRALFLTDTEIVLLDADGRRVRSWPHALGDISQATSYLSAAGDTVIAYGPLGMSVGRTA